MEIKQVSVDKLFSLGNYNNERIGLTANLSDGEDAGKAIAQLFLQITGIEDVFAMYRRAIDETEEATRRVESWKCRIENTKCELGKMKISMEELTAIISKGGEVADERLQHACRSKSYKDVKEQLEKEQKHLADNEKTLIEIKTLKEELKRRISEGVFNTDGLSVPLIPNESVYYG
jgi:hypothetical protein